MTALLAPTAPPTLPAGTVVRVRKDAELTNAWGDVLLIGEMSGVVVACAGDECRVWLTSWGRTVVLPLAVLEVME